MASAKERKIKEKKPGGSELSLSNILTFVVVVIVAVAVVLTLAFYITVYKDSAEQSAMTYSQQAVEQVANNITDYTDELYAMMTDMHENSLSDPELQEQLYEEYLRTRPNIVMIATYDAEGRMTGCWTNREEGFKEDAYSNQSVPSAASGVLDPELYSGESASCQTRISPPHVVTILNGEYPWVVTVVRDVHGSYSNVEYICVDVRVDSITGYLDRVGIGQHGYAYIIDQDGVIIYHPHQQLISAKTKSEYLIDGSKDDGSYISNGVLYTVRSLDSCSWRIVGVTYLEESVSTRVRTMTMTAIICVVLVTLIAFWSGRIFTRLFTKPVHNLTNAMREFEKDAQGFNYEPVEGTVEVKNLSNSFEHMVVRIQKLMNDVKEEEKSLRKTELKALQAQINPHFLYNSLDSIAWMCEDGRNPEAISMVNALARLFRISISRGEELIPIDKEVQHAESYLQIQKFRYKSQFDYAINVEDGIGSYLCNKITLQPIIENALYHGLNMIDEGFIDIRIYKRDNDIVMEVKDNGVGMTEEQIEKILHKSRSDSSGIGIKNVDDRIRIYFGDEYGIKITSELDVGTKVTITFPVITEDTKYDK